MNKLRARTIFSDATCTVTAIERLTLRSGTLGRGLFVSGSLRPTAVIVKLGERIYALDMAAQAVDPDCVELPAGFDLE